MDPEAAVYRCPWCLTPCIIWGKHLEFTCVRPQMNCEVVARTERLSTIIAFFGSGFSLTETVFT